ncbi:MAG: replication-associated recombination protein A [Solobacterium sp.]|nr:replication-associated recombination protein A [Solobacterium sp.]
MSLFDLEREESVKEPLAYRMRPQTLEEVVGQKDLIGEGRLLRRMIEADRLRSLIFYGPPGSGKTTLANVIANTTSALFWQLNAADSGKKEMEKVVDDAKYERKANGRKTILFIDEIHRFNKAQQDYLLPFVEADVLTLIGATTENPYFEVNRALLSRSTVFELQPLTAEDLLELLQRAAEDPVRGIAGEMVRIQEEALAWLAHAADGDARAALNALELAVLTTPRSDDGYIDVDMEVVQECIQKRSIHYDKDGDQHYDIISAFIKSLRGSDPDAALYWLARMLSAGEDPRFIARRMMIQASEDCGNADPRALQIAVSASLAVERVGMPEGQLILAQAAAYIASAPKSNAASAGIEKAMQEVQRSGNLPVPAWLRDAHYNGASALGRGTDYKYPHDWPDHYVDQQYLPDRIKHMTFYDLSSVAYEQRLRNWFDSIGKKNYGKERK